MNYDPKEVGNRIKNIRKSKGLNQNEFAKLVKATVPAVSNWENGRNLPNNERLEFIAKVANISVKQLLEGTPTEKFTNYVATVKDKMSKQEKFLHARKMITTFSSINTLLEQSMLDKNLNKEEIEVALNFQKEMARAYFSTLFTPEELKEWENIYLPNE